MVLSIADKLLMRQHEFLQHLGREYTPFSSREDEHRLTSSEAHHRIKNNLQMISSLIHLQAQQASHPEARQCLNEALARLETFTRLHNTLSRSEQADIVDLRAYFKELCDALGAITDMQSSAVRLHVEVDELAVPASLAVDMGMALNELVTNALKHAFPDNSGDIRITCWLFDDQLEMCVNDNGRGMDATQSLATLPAHPPVRGNAVDLREMESLGMAIVREIASKHQAVFSLLHDRPGTQACLRFPWPNTDKNA